MLIAVPILILYLVFVAGVFFGFQKAVSRPLHNFEKCTVTATVLVPFRDEASNLRKIIDSLRIQTYPRFNVILIDDHSSDNSLAIATMAIGDDPRFRIVTSSGEGKKSALTDGVALSDAEVIITTDADCIMNPTWVADLVAAFGDKKVMMTFGLVKIADNQTLFSSLQQMEFHAVLSLGLAATQYGMPLYCNGANLACRRSAFNEVGGYSGNEHIASGDDQFILEKIARRYETGIILNTNQDAIVTTEPQSSIGDFIKQRVRWAGKFRLASVSSFATAVLMAIMQFAYLSVVVSILCFEFRIYLAVLLAIKWMLDLMLLHAVADHLRCRFSVPVFFVLQVIYPFYVLYVGAVAAVSSVTWKGRPTRRHRQPVPGVEKPG